MPTYARLAKRLFNIAALLSAIAFCLTLVAWNAAGNIDPRTPFLSLSDHCHLGLRTRGSLDARLQVFNDASYGPYSGSIIGVSAGGRGPTSAPVWPKVWGIGDDAGVYYRMIRWQDGTSLWTLSLSLAYPLIAAALLPAVWIVRRSRRKVRGFNVGGDQTATKPDASLDH